MPIIEFKTIVNCMVLLCMVWGLLRVMAEEKKILLTCIVTPLRTRRHKLVCDTPRTDQLRVKCHVQVCWRPKILWKEHQQNQYDSERSRLGKTEICMLPSDQTQQLDIQSIVLQGTLIVVFIRQPSISTSLLPLCRIRPCLLHTFSHLVISSSKFFDGNV